MTEFLMFIGFYVTLVMGVGVLLIWWAYLYFDTQHNK